MKPPKKLFLKAINETWEIIYKLSFSGNATIKIIEPKTIMITSRIRDRKYALHKWLQLQGRKHLIPWLDNLSIQTNLPYNRVSIRGQKTRWGSCSSAKNINLNYKLLFLEQEFVSYIIIHELCHTMHLNHSKEFWQLVSSFYPNYRELRKQLLKYKYDYGN